MGRERKVADRSDMLPVGSTGADRRPAGAEPVPQPPIRREKCPIIVLRAYFRQTLPVRAPPRPTPTPPAEARGEEFTRLLVQHQRRIQGLVFALVTRGPDADDVMQETCAVMWRKFDGFRPGSDFGAWALRIARYQVMSYYDRRRRAQARLSDETIEALAETMAEARWETSERAEALRTCISKLRDRDFNLIQRRYRADEDVRDIAVQLGSTADAIYKAIGRLHLRLLACVNARLRVAPP